MSTNRSEFSQTLALIRFWRHQRNAAACYITGDTLRAYRQKCTNEIQKYIRHAKALKESL